jgi:peptidoglycan/LPS O-acetylase OafA/YrhL
MRVRGLDSWRFVLASWVVIGHFGLVPIPASWQEGHLRVPIRGLYANLISGPAAVIVFFVISGFCIHFPYRRAQRISLLPYFSRRHVRILTPALVAVWLGTFVGIKLVNFDDSILWSLFCEEIYYVLYPLLLRARARFGWMPLTIVAFIGAYGVVALLPNSGNYPSYGLKLNWLVGLPCWLMGCSLAEGIDADLVNVSPTRRSLWLWRMTLLAASVVCSVLRFHTRLSYPWTLDLFAIAVVAWLRREIVFARHHGPGLFERFGSASYSIYVFHLVALGIYLNIGIDVGNAQLAWLMRIGAVLLLCTAFYFVVEKPSHAAARRLGNALLRWRGQAAIGGASEAIPPAR